MSNMNGWTHEKLTIGEVAKLHNLSVKTLRYWDEIGLFRPLCLDPETGYRYYSTKQFHKLNLIKHLKFIGASSQEIIELYEKADIGEFLKNLQKQQQILNQKILELIRVSHVLQCHINDFQEALQIGELGVVKIKQLPARKIVRINMDITNRLQLEALLRKMETMITTNGTILVHKAVLTIASQDFMQQEFSRFNGAFILTEDYQPKDEAFVTELPEGQYAIVNFFGNMKSSQPYYEMLYNYVLENDYEICGDIERRPIAITVDNNMAGYYAEVCAPIKTKI